MDKYIGKIPHFHGFEEHKTRTAVPYTDSSEIWHEGGHLQLASSCQFTFIGEAMWGLSPKTCQILEFLVHICPQGANPLSNFVEIWNFIKTKSIVVTTFVSAMVIDNVLPSLEVCTDV